MAPQAHTRGLPLAGSGRSEGRRSQWPHTEDAPRRKDMTLTFTSSFSMLFFWCSSKEFMITKTDSWMCLSNPAKYFYASDWKKVSCFDILLEGNSYMYLLFLSVLATGFSSSTMAIRRTSKENRIWFLHKVGQRTNPTKANWQNIHFWKTKSILYLSLSLIIDEHFNFPLAPAETFRITTFLLLSRPSDTPKPINQFKPKINCNSCKRWW